MAEKQANFNKKDVYGVIENDYEVDSDMNEDRNREQLLDESLIEFVDVFNVKGKQK